MSWFLGVYKKYAVFSGRARRKEFWFFTFFFLTAFALLWTVDITVVNASETYFTLLSVFYMLASLLPILAVTVRRLHDTDRSGWWVLLNWIPFGNIVLIVFLCLDSSPGQNRFGANPKLETASE